MAFTTPAFVPATGLKDTATFVTTPASETAARKQIQDVLDQALAATATLIGELEDETSGSSGGELVHTKALVGVTGTTISAQIADLKTQIDGVSAGVVADASITTAKLAADAVTGAQVADDAIDSEHYVDGSIDKAHLSADCVDGTKIGDDSIDSEHYVAGSIDAEHLASSSVEEAKIKAGAVTTTKLGTVQSITLDTGDTLTYDTANNLVMLNVSGCTAVQLCPIVFGTGATAPAGTYPKGTIYVQYTA